MSKKPTPAKTRKRPDLGVRWTEGERSEIDAIAKEKGIKATQVVRMAFREYLMREKKRREIGL